LTKIKILFVRPTLGSGGADRVTLNLLQGFNREKYQVSLALMKKEGILLSLVPADVPLIDMNKRSLYRVLPALVSLYNTGGYDVVYCTSSGMSIPVIIASLVSSSKSALTVVSERSSMERRRLGGLKNKVIFKLKCWLTSKADYIVTVSDTLRSEVLQYTYAKENQVVRSYNPIIPSNLSDLKNEHTYSAAFNTPNKKVVAIGRLEKVKNMELALHTLQKIESKNVSLFILGEGPLLENLKQLANTLEIADRIHFEGYVPNVYAYLSKADAFILTSNFEGMPGALIQALACGVPCVSRDCHTGPAELITDGENGFLVAMDNNDRLVDCMNAILKDKNVVDLEKAKESVLPYHHNHAIHSYFNFLEV
jgi:glycosyltransferase involved in cell wall biosynthesis